MARGSQGLTKHVAVGEDRQSYADDCDDEHIEEKRAKKSRGNDESRSIGASIEAIRLHAPPIRLL